MPSGLIVLEISVIHPAASTYMQVVRTVGGEPAVGDATKRIRYESIDPIGSAFELISVETLGNCEIWLWS